MREAYRSGAMTPVDVLTLTLARIDARNPAVNAMAYVDADGAAAAAKAATRRWPRARPWVRWTGFR